MNELETSLGYTITFFNNGYGQELDPIYNVNIVPELPILEEEGFIFEGWYLDEELTILAENGMELASNVTLYASWSRDRNYNTGTNNTYIAPDNGFDIVGGDGEITPSFPDDGTPDVYSNGVLAGYSNSSATLSTDILHSLIIQHCDLYPTVLVDPLIDNEYYNFKYKDSDGTKKNLKTIHPYAEDTWMVTEKYKFYGPQTLMGVRKGYFPTFQDQLFDITSPGTYTLKREDSTTRKGLVLLDSSGKEVNFKTTKDNSAPHYIIACVQGAGGGGGGTVSTESGSGGGAGGFVCAIIPCDTPLTLVVGAGGNGGKYVEDYSLGATIVLDYGGGKGGGDSSIANTGVSLVAYGGGGGGQGRNAGGAGGSYSVTGCETYQGIQGGSGSGAAGTGTATGMAYGKYYATKNTSLSWSTGYSMYKTYAATSGGAHGYESMAGGGGGSRYGNGGNGGDCGTAFTQDGAGKPGSDYGAGGGGATWTAVTYVGGGYGRSGRIEIWY